jgi:hypothetical protein
MRKDKLGQPLRRWTLFLWVIVEFGHSYTTRTRMRIVRAGAGFWRRAGDEMLVPTVEADGG